MDVFLSDKSRVASIYLYNPKNNEEITEAFFEKVYDDDILKLSEEEQRAYGTTATYMMSSTLFNEWCTYLNRQQDILDKADEASVSDELFTDILELNDIGGVRNG